MVDAGGEDSRDHVAHDQEARNGLCPGTPPNTDDQAHSRVSPPWPRKAVVEEAFH